MDLSKKWVEMWLFELGKNLDLIIFCARKGEKYENTDFTERQTAEKAQIVNFWVAQFLQLEVWRCFQVEVEKKGTRINQSEESQNILSWRAIMPR